MKNIFTPLDKRMAVNYTRNAAYVSLIIALITLAAICYSFFKHGWQSIAITDYLDFFLMCGLAYGAFKNNSFAIIVALVYYLGSRGYNLLKMPYGQGSYIIVIIMILFSYYYLQGIRGALALKRLNHEASHGAL